MQFCVTFINLLQKYWCENLFHENECKIEGKIVSKDPAEEKIGGKDQFKERISRACSEDWRDRLQTFPKVHKNLYFNFNYLWLLYLWVKPILSRFAIDVVRKFKLEFYNSKFLTAFDSKMLFKINPFNLIFFIKCLLFMDEAGKEKDAWRKSKPTCSNKGNVQNTWD